MHDIYNWKEVGNSFINILRGKDYTMCRSTNIVHVLGSVTVIKSQL